MSKQWRITNVKWHTSVDMTFDMAVERLSGFIATGTVGSSQLWRMAQAIGLAYGMSPQDVSNLAITEVAIARTDSAAALAIFPEWAQGPGADV